MPTDFSGYRGLWEFEDWEMESFSIKEPPETGHTFTVLATGVAAKANVETQGFALSGGLGARAAYNRKFYFAASYRGAGGATLGVGDHLAVGNILEDDEGNEWSIESVSNPGGADEHFEVVTVRGVQE